MKEPDVPRPDFTHARLLPSSAFSEIELEVMAQLPIGSTIIGSGIRWASLATRPGIVSTKLMLYVLGNRESSDLDVVLKPDKVPNPKPSRSDPRLVSSRSTHPNGKATDYLGWLPSDTDPVVACTRFAATTALALCAQIDQSRNIILFDPFSVLDGDPHEVCRPLNPPIDPCHYNSESAYRAVRSALFMVFGLPQMTTGAVTPEMDHNFHLLAQHYNPSLPQAESLIELLTKLDRISITTLEATLFANHLFASSILRVLAVSALTIYDNDPKNFQGVNLVSYYIWTLLTHANMDFPPELFAKFYSGVPLHDPPERLARGLQGIADYSSRFPTETLLVDPEARRNEENLARMAYLDSKR